MYGDEIIDWAPMLPPGAVLYTRETLARDLLALFAAELADRGFRVGGVVQEPVLDQAGNKAGVDVVEVDGGRRIPIARPTPGQLAEGVCALDLGGLAESTNALRRALESRCDLVVAEKFGDREKTGGGLAQDLLAVMAEGLPTLVAVPATSLESWQTFSGGLGVLLPSDMAALWRWWGPERLYRDIELAVPEDALVARVTVGPAHVLVEGAHGVGLAENSGRTTLAEAQSWIGRPLREMAALVHAADFGRAALGLAAVAAHCNRFDFEVGPTVGRPDIELPDTLLADHRIVDILMRERGGVMLRGIGLPLCRRLFVYGISGLEGWVCEDRAAAAARVIAGDDPLPAGRRVTFSAPV